MVFARISDYGLLQLIKNNIYLRKHIPMCSKAWFYASQAASHSAAIAWAEACGMADALTCITLARSAVSFLEPHELTEYSRSSLRVGVRAVRFGQVLARDKAGRLEGFGTLVGIISISTSRLSSSMPAALSASPASAQPTCAPLHLHLRLLLQHMSYNFLSQTTNPPSEATVMSCWYLRS